MTSQTIYATYSPLGDISVEIQIESWGYPSNGWDDPGAGIEWYLERLMNESETIVWYLPNNDYQAVEQHIDAIVQALEPDDDMGWI